MKLNVVLKKFRSQLSVFPNFSLRVKHVALKLLPINFVKGLYLLILRVILFPNTPMNIFKNLKYV
jgi:hypothetical protein